MHFWERFSSERATNLSLFRQKAREKWKKIIKSLLPGYSQPFLRLVWSDMHSVRLADRKGGKLKRKNTETTEWRVCFLLWWDRLLMEKFSDWELEKVSCSELGGCFPIGTHTRKEKSEWTFDESDSLFVEPISEVRFFLLQPLMQYKSYNATAL